MARWLKVGPALAVLLVVAACSTQYRDHGYVPTEEDLAKLKLGQDTRETVTQNVGSPGTAGVLSDSAWFYVKSRYEHYAYREPKEIDRQVVQISFDNSGHVSNIERFGLERGQVVVLSRRVTQGNTEGIGFLRQLFGSIGRINPSQLFGGNTDN